MEIDLTGLVRVERVEIAEVSDDGRSAEFVMEPLQRGYGHTLGNAIRRVLLSSLRGSAIWAFRIEGVVHEHQVIPFVVEDVHQVIQSLKSLVVSLDDDVDAATLTIQVKKAGSVTASKIKGPASVTVHDPDHHILTLEQDRNLNIEMFVNKGRGFVLAEQHSATETGAADLVRIDAVYNPVRRANFVVEETRVGQRTDFDRLTLHVETDGSMAPASAVEYAAELIRRHFEYMLYFRAGGLPRSREAEALPVSERMFELFRTPIEDLAGLSVRSRNSLQRESIATLGDLVSCTEDDLLGIDNFGKKSLEEISRVLGERGLRFGMKVEERDDGRIYFLDGGGTGGSDESLPGA